MHASVGTHHINHRRNAGTQSVQSWRDQMRTLESNAVALCCHCCAYDPCTAHFRRPNNLFGTYSLLKVGATVFHSEHQSNFSSFLVRCVRLNHIFIFVSFNQRIGLPVWIDRLRECGWHGMLLSIIKRLCESNQWRQLMSTQCKLKVIRRTKLNLRLDLAANDSTWNIHRISRDLD